MLLNKGSQVQGAPNSSCVQLCEPHVSATSKQIAGSVNTHLVVGGFWFHGTRADGFHTQLCVCDVPSSDPRTTPLLLGGRGAEVMEQRWGEQCSLERNLAVRPPGLSWEAPGDRSQHAAEQKGGGEGGFVQNPFRINWQNPFLLESIPNKPWFYSGFIRK